MSKLHLNILKDVRRRLDALIKDCEESGFEYVDAYGSEDEVDFPFIGTDAGYVELDPSDSYNGEDDLLETFLKYHENPDNYGFSDDVYDKVYEVLDKYVDRYENPNHFTVDVLFERMSDADKRKVIRYFESEL